VRRHVDVRPVEAWLKQQVFHQAQIQILLQVIRRGLVSRRSCGSGILCRLLRRYRIELSRIIKGRLLITSSRCCRLSILRKLWTIGCLLFVAAWIVRYTENCLRIRHVGPGGQELIGTLLAHHRGMG